MYVNKSLAVNSKHTETNQAGVTQAGPNSKN